MRDRTSMERRKTERLPNRARVEVHRQAVPPSTSRLLAACMIALSVLWSLAACAVSDRSDSESRLAPRDSMAESAADDSAPAAPQESRGPGAIAPEPRAGDAYVDEAMDAEAGGSEADAATRGLSAPRSGSDGAADTQAGSLTVLPTEAERAADAAFDSRPPRGPDGRGEVRRYPLPEAPYHRPPDDMFFHDWGINPWQESWRDNRSTFGLDVDTGSYTLVRSYLDQGHLPPAEAVRVEEMINRIDQGYRQPWTGDFHIQLDGAENVYGEERGEALLRVGIQAREVSDWRRQPARLTFVVDTSGSMREDGRLELVKDALRTLVGGLDSRDAVAIVGYDDRAWVALPMTSVADRRGILRALDRLQPGGSTNAEAGLSLGYDLAGEGFDPESINRVVLCSDGVANVGATGPRAILQRVARELDRGITLTAVGVGMGNYNDALLEQLADHGDGSYHYVDDLREAERVFGQALTGTLQLVARDAKVQVEFNPETVWAYRLIGYENRDVADRDFRDDRVDAGEIGAGHSATALYALSLVPEARGELGVVRLRWADPDSGEVNEIEELLDAGDLAPSWDRAPAHFRLTASLAAFGELLRESPYVRGLHPDRLIEQADLAARELDSDEAWEVADLIDRACGRQDYEGIGGRDRAPNYGYP